MKPRKKGIILKRKKSAAGWTCVFCGRQNPEKARFCGACGCSKAGLKSAIETKFSGNTPIETNAAIEKEAIRSLKDKVLIGSLATFIFLSFLLFSVFANKYFESRNTKNTVTWKEFRAFLSHRFMLTNNELDSIIMPKCNINNTESSIEYYNVGQIEAALNEKFHRSDVNLFPNPYFKSTLASEQKAGFVDVPLDHPVYTALKTMLELGIKPQDSYNRILPYEKISWTSWKNVSLQVMKILSLNDSFVYEFTRNKTGNMTNYDVNNFIRMIRKKAGLNINEGLLWSDKKFYPSRLEAYSVLSQVLSELSS